MEKKKIPLHLKIRRRFHREIAWAQDVIVEVLYSVFPRAVLHGGTAIWRCYGGNRFSEDLDVYLEKRIEKVNQLFDEIKRRGFEIQKRRVKESSLFSTLQLGGARVRLEGLFKRVGGVLREYETCEGNLLTVYALSPEKLLEEKVEAYLARYKVRDLYDAFFLLRLVEKSKNTVSAVSKMIKGFRTPVDEKELKTVVLYGAVPSAREMFEYMKRWVK